MKKFTTILILLLLTLCMALTVTACGSDGVSTVESVTLDKTALSLTVGETAVLTATVSPEDAADKTVIWESSDSAVATVDGGEVAAVAEGTATVTAKVGEKSAACTVTVSAAQETPTPAYTKLSDGEWENCVQNSFLSGNFQIDVYVIEYTSDPDGGIVVSTGTISAEGRNVKVEYECKGYETDEETEDNMYAMIEGTKYYSWNEDKTVTCYDEEEDGNIHSRILEDSYYGKIYVDLGELDKDSALWYEIEEDDDGWYYYGSSYYTVECDSITDVLSIAVALFDPAGEFDGCTFCELSAGDSEDATVTGTVAALGGYFEYDASTGIYSAQLKYGSRNVYYSIGFDNDKSVKLIYSEYRTGNQDQYGKDVSVVFTYGTASVTLPNV